MSAQGTPGSLVPRRASKLEAVNYMLRTIHERPVSSLEDVGVTDAQDALAVLEDVNRSVQANGWHFNTHICANWHPQSTNMRIKIPTSCLKADAIGYPGRRYDIIQDGDWLYNLTLGTFEFDKPVTVTWVELKDFERLPQAARDYIRIKAARIFIQQSLASTSDAQLTQEQEYYALAVLRNSEAQTADNNILTGNYTTFKTVRRDRR